MRRLLLALPLLVAACATYDPASDTRTWIEGDAEGQARLMYGTPDSDDVGIGLNCTPRSGRVELWQGGRRPGDGITLASGGERVVLHGEETPDELEGGMHVSVVTDIRNPVLARFAATGELVSQEGGRASRFHATPQERAVIARFFETCAA